MKKRPTTGYSLTVSEAEPKRARGIVLITDPGLMRLGEEAHSMVVMPERVTVRAPKPEAYDMTMQEISRRQLVAAGAFAFGGARTVFGRSSNPASSSVSKGNYPGRNLLSGTYPLDKLSSLLIPWEQWKPFPRAAERASWNQIPADAREAAVERGAKQLESGWPFLPAAYFLDYVRIGNRQKADNIRRARRTKLRDLALAECMEHRGRFPDAILNGLWTTCEESYWGSPAHLSLQKTGLGLPDISEPTVDLFAADTAALLAWTDYLLGEELDEVSPLIRKRIYLEVNRRVLVPCEERDDFWWMGTAAGGPKRNLNNWTPWIDSNWLAAVLLLERDERRRRRTVHKILRSLDSFLEGYHDDGGCDEGPGYWNRAGGSLFDCLELLHSASNGRIDVYADPLIREIGRYIVRAHICDDYYTNIGDASAIIHIAGDMVYRYGRRIGDRDMQLLGAWAAAGKTGETDSMSRALPSLFDLDTIRGAPKKQALLRDAWLPGIQLMAARLRQGSAGGLYVAAHGGHNAESHNHNDAGDFIIYADGKPAIIDIGSVTYTAKTFSSHRYEIWAMQSGWHNLPTVNGVMQAAGREFQATGVSCRADDRRAEFSLDIAKAYPVEAGIKSWKRTITLDRQDNQVSVRDSFQLSRPASEITLTLMTPCAVRDNGAGKLTLAGAHFPGGPVVAEYDPAAFRLKTEEVRVKDAHLKRTWGDRLCRILLIAKGSPSRGDWLLRFSQAAPA